LKRIKMAAMEVCSDGTLGGQRLDDFHSSNLVVSGEDVRKQDVTRSFFFSFLVVYSPLC
jgi:hypothetical protein